MNYRDVGITHTASFLPKKIVTNQDIVDMGVDTNDTWIREKLGIKERRWADKEATSDLAAEAGKRVLEKAKLKPEKVDLIVIATSTPDSVTPSTSCYVQEKIGAVNAGAFDVLNACSGFNYGVATASKFVADNSYDNVLVVGAEIPSRFRVESERTNYTIFSDGAGAVLLQEVEKGFGLKANYLRADGRGANKLVVKGFGTAHSREENAHLYIFAKMDGRAIWDFALKAIPDAVNNCLKKANMKKDELDFIIFHQANLNIIKEGMKILGLPMEKTFTNIEKYGNTIAASIPIALNEAIEKGKIKQGDNVMLVGFGAGLSWGANLLKWY
ncbi:MAG: 3-oxoacyl-ACP synthase [Candidatus Diapherotrites archaeon]|uniref:3-oxoacyl-ACP synthase n=1 Tax=Candidatus Iainarchaeum sp. TaxID=3101447 RepID=A0A2D6LPU1_9ARCH|nr:3-oxoacyl-ACP synthase [Candidatus Diapherotrites archaeon]|tara:strand:+ start:10404 stop:11387 length:984 start_codon:yes stop_codon:yes gene_type:complete